MDRRFIALLTTLLFAISSAVSAEQLIREFSGSRSTETAEFEVEPPWLIDWWVNGDYPQMLGAEISLIDATTGTHAGYVLKTKTLGNGVRLLKEGGRYRFKVDATMARWKLKVIQLSPEEAKQYTPVEQNER